METISASVARQTLPAQLDRVEGGEQIAITRHGRVVAVLVDPATLVPRRASRAWGEADRIRALLEEARARPVRGAAISIERADGLVEAVRRGRAER
ncbi:type II toxin-antitoxin system prevent-host-death family antitoxin [Pseudactinotalea sp. HY160]|uniref:type II toxin-antitoxin system Phd/YefM family antitoxin n=1 Tax=Pseudactinotalea sp. HY160 TaxID=2654490 RepID=UPI00128D9B71|nr:type II toxin-antitoxin system prevent-host-death family antitoxin [Pseudactinotalea sp. HY160]MPV49869.1 type II toxin-antitoxin system prevent-host-death family antitoxin [Pseudactinotalea sp. HY160]